MPRKHKIGHLGTLDPMAIGVLPVALGQANKFLQYINDQRKEYLATFFLGARSDTQDIWGSVESTGSISFDFEHLESVLQSFRGTTWQIPPMYSAVHHQGKRLYELARQGIVVERPAREIEIDHLQLVKVEESVPWPQITIKVVCSPGTYIRTLGHDIGEELGTGAVLNHLVRIRSGPFNIKEAVSMEQLPDQELGPYLLPPDFPLRNLPEVSIPEQAESSWRNGRAIEVNHEPLAGRVRVYSAAGRFLGVAEFGKSSGSWLQPLRLLI